MDVSAPHLAVLSPAVGGVLSVLTGTARPLSGREVARLGGVAPTTAARTLQQLAVHGLVKVQEAGAGVAFLYTFNHDHLAASAMVALMGLRRSFIKRLEQALDDWRVPPVHASLFGSAARGDGDTASDIDLFIVRPDATGVEEPQWRSQVDRLPDLIMNWTGNTTGIAEVAERDLERWRDDDPPVAAELKQDAITLVGPSVRVLLKGRTR